MKKYIKPEVKSFDAQLVSMLALSSHDTFNSNDVSYGKEEFWGDEEW